VLLAIYQRHVGSVGLGDLMHVLLAIEILYWIATIYLFSRWSRAHWTSCVLPTMLLLPYFWSASIGLHHPNHSPYRTAGITIALAPLMAFRRASARANQWAAGTATGLAILANLESGIAATAGLVVYLYRRFGPGGADRRPAALLRMVARFAAGLLA